MRFLNLFFLSVLNLIITLKLFLLTSPFHCTLLTLVTFLVFIRQKLWYLVSFRYQQTVMCRLLIDQREVSLLHHHCDAIMKICHFFQQWWHYCVIFIGQQRRRTGINARCPLLALPWWLLVLLLWWQCCIEGRKCGKRDLLYFTLPCRGKMLLFKK